MITGPELDLLQEVLAEDPTADIYLDVAHALLDRGDARQAAVVLRRALEFGVRDLDTARLLARTASEIGDDKGLRVAADALGEQAMRSEPALARSYAVALDRAGDLDKAGSLAQQLLGLHGDDAELRAIVQRMNASMPDQDTRARDPFFTVRRAEAYLENGRIDLAIRTYRRILAYHPGHQGVRARLLRLRAMPRESRPWVDDLSEEYWVSRPMSALSMPAPTLVPDLIVPPEEEATVPGPPARVAGPGGPPLRGSSSRAGVENPFADTFEDEEETTIMREEDLPTSVFSRSNVLRRSEDLDEEATEMFDARASRELRRRIPGVDDLRAALAEDDEDADSVSDSPGPDGDADSIIEQARAIERAADRRRRSLFRK